MALNDTAKTGQVNVGSSLNDHILRMGQVNVGRCESSLVEVVRYAAQYHLDYVLVQEPYCVRKGQGYKAGTFVGGKVFPEESSEPI